jgi:DeoR family suf operon transcriptional repressor
MRDVSVSLGGYRGVRAELLVALKKAQPVTAHELGAQFGLTPNALRRYLKMLDEEGLVSYSRVVRGLGAPVFAFSLTEAGEALFPRTYASVLETALTALRAGRGNEAVRDVFAAEWASLAADAKPLMSSLPVAERASLLAELLTARGYMAEAITEPASASPDGDVVTTLRLHHCSMREIAGKFPEACVAEAEAVQQIMGVPLVRHAHQLTGCRTCDYSTALAASTTTTSRSESESSRTSQLALAEEQA